MWQLQTTNVFNVVNILAFSAFKTFSFFIFLSSQQSLEFWHALLQNTIMRRFDVLQDIRSCKTLTHSLAIVAASWAGLRELLLRFRTLCVCGVGVRRDGVVALWCHWRHRHCWRRRRQKSDSLLHLIGSFDPPLLPALSSSCFANHLHPKSPFLSCVCSLFRNYLVFGSLALPFCVGTWKGRKVSGYLLTWVG